MTHSQLQIEVVARCQALPLGITTIHPSLQLSKTYLCPSIGFTEGQSHPPPPTSTLSHSLSLCNVANSNQTQNWGCLGTSEHTLRCCYHLPEILPSAEASKNRRGQTPPGSVTGKTTFTCALLLPWGVGRAASEFLLKSFLKQSQSWITKLAISPFSLHCQHCKNLYSICKYKTWKVLSWFLRPHSFLSYKSTVLLKSMDFSGLNKT